MLRAVKDKFKTLILQRNARARSTKTPDCGNTPRCAMVSRPGQVRTSSKPGYDSTVSDDGASPQTQTSDARSSADPMPRGSVRDVAGWVVSDEGAPSKVHRT